jgi:hypothetical protein
VRRYDLPLPPLGIWVYYTKEDETLEQLVAALYPTAACEVLLAHIVEFQVSARGETGESR